MKKALLLCSMICVLVLLTTLVNCKSNEAVAVNIEVYGVYEITDENELDTTLNTTYTSTDKSVAVLRSGKYICGLRPGKTRIEVNHDGKIINYDVVVAPNPKGDKFFMDDPDSFWSGRLTTLKIKDVDRNDIMFGYCFNVLDGKEFVQEAIGKECVFDWDAVLKSNNIRVDNSENMEFTSYSGETLDIFYDSYKNKETVKLTAKLGKIKLFDKTFEKSKSNLISNEKKQSINQLYWKYTKASYILDEPDEDYEKYLKEDAKASLMGTDGTTVEDFIKKYGTHIIVGGCYGGTFEINYNLDDKELIEQSAEVISFINSYLNIDNTGTSYDIYYLFNNILNDKSYESSFSKSMHKLAFKNVFQVAFTGGQIEDWESAVIYNSLDDCDLFGCNYDFHAWLKGMNEKEDVFIDRDVEFVVDFCYISPINEQSLIPVWELIDTDTQAGKDRKKEFVDYIKKA